MVLVWPHAPAAALSTGMYAYEMTEDSLLHIDAHGINTTVGKVGLSQRFLPVAGQCAVAQETATMYVLAAKATNDSETVLVGISLADASITAEVETPLRQLGLPEIGLGMTIDASAAGLVVLTGVDRLSDKHTAYAVDPSKGHVRKLSDGFLADARYAHDSNTSHANPTSLSSRLLWSELCVDSAELDFAHCLDVRSSVFWLTSPSRNYSESGLFDLVGVDVLKGAEVARHTMCNQMAAACDKGVPHVHAMAHDASTGGLLALGLNASSLTPFVFTIDTAAFEARVVARFEAFSAFNGIAAWDAKRRALYGLAMKSEAVQDPVLIGYSMAAEAMIGPGDLCIGGSGCTAPVILGFFDAPDARSVTLRGSVEA